MADKRFSILTDNLTKCIYCGSHINIHKHEVFFGSNRKKSIKYGLVVPLCRECHQGTSGVHGRDGHDLDTYLKKLAQEAFEKEYPDKDFIQEFGKNYL